jgi:hypothetical protein
LVRVSPSAIVEEIFGGAGEELVRAGEDVVAGAVA